jgi:hypothetical protein
MEGWCDREGLGTTTHEGYILKDEVWICGGAPDWCWRKTVLLLERRERELLVRELLVSSLSLRSFG